MSSSNFDYDDPKYWKLGIFYYNKEDKRLFPPKSERWGAWTINFANPYSIIAYLIFLTVLILLMNILKSQ